MIPLEDRRSVVRSVPGLWKWGWVERYSKWITVREVGRYILHESAPSRPESVPL
jgi:hypothetical protein